MKVYVIFAQRRERYPGEYGLEALEVMTENDVDSNPDFMPEKLEENRASGDFASVAIVTLDVSEGEVRKILQPASTTLPAKVVQQDSASEAP